MDARESVCVSVGAKVMNLVRVADGVIDPDAVEDELNSSSTSSRSSTSGPTRSRGIVVGDLMGSGDLTRREEAAFGE